MSNPSHGVAIHLAQCCAAGSKIKIQFLTTKPIGFAIATQDLEKKKKKLGNSTKILELPFSQCSYVKII